LPPPLQLLRIAVLQCSLPPQFVFEGGDAHDANGHNQLHFEKTS
jgi:hypothetical protein